ncbi:MAG: porin [Alphaproteobacteria bacterium]|nr:porin [Alphaproteobacteria bacterium]
MKQILFGTTALVAAGMLTGTAFAEDPIKLSLGGFYQAAMGHVFDDGEENDSERSANDHHDYAIKQNIEIYFLGSTTLDNGLTVGTRVELEGQNNGDQIDAAYAYFRGGFGEIRVGDFGSVGGLMCLEVPSAGLFGASGMNAAFIFTNVQGRVADGGGRFPAQEIDNNTMCDTVGSSDKATKIAYFTPVLSGFRMGVSYAPNDAEDEPANQNGTRSDKDEGQNSEQLSLGAEYSNKFGAVGVNMAAFWERAFKREKRGGGKDGQHMGDNETWGIGGTVGFAGFTLGANFNQTSNIDNIVDDIDSTKWGLGATYNWDEWTLGLGYAHGSYDAVSLDGLHKNGHDRDTLDTVSFSMQYALGPGITLDAGLNYDVYDDARDEGQNDLDGDYKGVSIATGFGITF